LDVHAGKRLNHKAPGYWKGNRFPARITLSLFVEIKTAEFERVKRYWDMIADNLSKAGCSWSCVSAVDACGRTIWIALTRIAATI
jgi:hypothetical protein